MFDRALSVPLAQRPAFLDEVCGADTALRQDLGSLLEAHESAAGYFDHLAEQLVSPAYAGLRGSPDAATRSALLPQLQAALGDSYRLEQELSGGAMSRVFVAEEVKLGRKVVIKVLPPELTASVSAERFRREIQLVAQLQHPHIVPLLTSDSTTALLWFTMPFVEGESLRARLARDEEVTVRDATKIWHDVLDALAYAHARGVVHRDVKPANILLGGRNALVTDFGIARAIEAAAEDTDATGTGLTIGTPAYMAPEQVVGEGKVDHRADIYAAALVMYEMLERQPPFTARSARELVLARLTEEPRAVSRPDCPQALSELVRRCLAKDPSARPMSAEAVLAELESVSSGAQHSVSATVPRRLRRISGYSLAGAAALATLGGAWQLTQRVERSASPTASAPSIAVLPLRNLGSDSSDAVLSNGMTEELIAALGRGGNLRVIASTSVLALQNRKLDVRQMAESLRVSHVLEGGLQRAGSRLRMQVRLVDAHRDSSVWSETFDREMGDVFAMQDDIARAVALKLGAQLVEGKPRGRNRHTPNVVAHEWYLRGLSANLVLRNESGRRQGVEYFNRAIAADSMFADAYAQLAWLHLNEAGVNAGNHREAFARGKTAALKAVALDDSLANAHSALGWAHLTHRGWASAEAEFKRAIELDLRAHRGSEGLARTYMLFRRPSEQLVAARLSLETDPYSTQAMREMALALNMNGRCDETLELLRPLKTLSPPAEVAGVVMGLCHIRRQMWPEAITEFRWASEEGARAAPAFLGYSLARSGRRDQAMALLSDMLAGRKDSHGAFGIAVVYVGLRDYDRAFAWLSKAVEESSWRVYIMDPIFEDLHRDPRFDRIMVPATQKR